VRGLLGNWRSYRDGGGARSRISRDFLSIMFDV